MIKKIKDKIFNFGKRMMVESITEALTHYLALQSRAYQTMDENIDQSAEISKSTILNNHGQNFNNLFTNDKTPALYHEFYEAFTRNIDSFSSYIGNVYDEEKLIFFLENMLIAVARNGFANNERKLKLFYDAEKFGVHILPVHFYSPVPNITEYNQMSNSDFFSVEYLNYDIPKMISLLGSFKEYKNEIVDISHDQVSDTEYYYNNSAIGGSDASIYYYMIRHFKPKNLVEIGSGFSTLMAAKAVRKNGSTFFYAIEPYPFEFLKKGIPGLNKLIPKKIQEVPLEFFEQLEAGDILFVDNSHVSKVGSDVNHIFLNIMPRLKSGVIIHFHDVFLPYEMPKRWINELGIFWNEQYMLHATLLANGQYTTLMPVNYMCEKFKNDVSNILPKVMTLGGGSYWIIKTEK